ncbi:MAG TPA: tRNA glutamyl-Q(34) synthetase GluQRS [Rhizomicrobium sp.]|nr:tRNA glutamyl-Q(34) synthetase GluQRS [Rhizomicrobium sp.]
MIVTRFAPSPTGYLHLGHAFAALTAQEAAERGRFLLRIEDLDATRAREEYVRAILEDLRWLGLEWHGPVLRQSARLDTYRAALDRLAVQELLYPCFCTRAEVAAEIARAAEAPHGPDGPLYPGTCRSLSPNDRAAALGSGTPYALRLDSGRAASRLSGLSFEERGEEGEFRPIAVDPHLFDDIVLARKETPASYHLAVVVDDAEQGVTLVTRGKDLLAATHAQRVLQTLLGLPAPRYAHHRLILDEAGRKLAKRDGSATLGSLRQQGATAREIRVALAIP